MSDDTPPASVVEPLLKIMRRLRDPEAGCPWDLEQTFTSLVPYTIEEAYEVADAIERQDMADLRSELGDLLFQIVFYAQLAKEQNLFDFQQVVDGICEKMVCRHPHVFADAHHADAEAQSRHWEQLKAEERRNKPQQEGPLDDIPRALPALTRAQKLQGRAERLGLTTAADLDTTIKGIIDTLHEVQHGKASDITTQELPLAQLLFASVTLVRKQGLDAESLLQQANEQFRRQQQPSPEAAHPGDDD